ncbi:iron ABC transporter permease [Anoxynatronum sibiricum]|uniref:Iron ABC transporter permease n=1 Tax=Anoxynatronum sibiricum TaxID=210623 RepID=A0ABU9VXC3_9CLOT
MENPSPIRAINKTKHEMTMLLKEPLLLAVLILIFASIFIFVLLPIFKVIQFSLLDADHQFSLVTLRRIISNAGYRKTFWNSIKLGGITAVLATVIGYFYAFAVTRTEMPLKRFFKIMAMLPIVSPPFILSLSIIFLFGRLGLITNNLLGIRTFNVYGLHSLIVVQTLSFFPIAYLTLTGILESIDPSVEDAALNMGASRWYIFRTVTLPLSMPGVVSALLLVFIQSLEDFSNPAVIAGDYRTLAVEAYRVITGMYDLRSGAVLALFLLMPTMMAFLLQKYWISGKSFVTVTGKPSQERPRINEPHIMWPLFAICMLLSGIIIMFYGTVLVGAFVNVWGIDYTFTLKHFLYVFSTGFQPLKNSVTLALIATPVTGVLGMIIAFLVVRKQFIGKRVLEFSSMLTFAVPGTVVGIGYILAFNQRPLLLTGTAFILVAAFVFRNMPVGIEAGTSALLQIDGSIEEASTNLGAGSFYTFRKITLPLIKQAFFSGLVYSFVRSMTAVSTIIFLISARWNLVTARIFSLFEVSQYSAAAAYIVIMIIVIMVVIGILNFLVSKIGRNKMA